MNIITNIKNLYIDLKIEVPDYINHINDLDINTLEILAYSQIEGTSIIGLNKTTNSLNNVEDKIIRTYDNENLEKEELLKYNKDIKVKNANIYSKHNKLDKTLLQIKKTILNNSIQYNNKYKNTNLELFMNYPILSRLTFDLKDKKELALLNTLDFYNLKDLDIMAVIVNNETNLEYCCNELYNIDIISINCIDKINFYSKKKKIFHAIDKGIYFEFNISEFISNDSNRNLFIYNFSMFIEITKGKNLIISTGCSNYIHHRNPTDISIILQTLFNIKPDMCQRILCNNSKNLVEKSMKRKYFSKGMLLTNKNVLGYSDINVN